MHPKLGYIRHYSFHIRRYVTCVYQIALWPRDPILLVHTVQDLDCHEIIICQRDAFVSGNQGTPKLAIYATVHSTIEGMQPVCTKKPFDPESRYCWYIQCRVQNGIKSLSARGTSSFLGTKAPQTWPYTPLFIPQQRVCILCVSNSPLT